jgi:hypothetical protein
MGPLTPSQIVVAMYVCVGKIEAILGGDRASTAHLPLIKHTSAHLLVGLKITRRDYD